MTYTHEGLFIVCSLEGKIKTVQYCSINVVPGNIEGKLFIDLFDKEYIGKALDFLLEIKKVSASFGWELILKPVYSDEPFYFSGALINGGIIICGSKTKVDFANFLSAMSQISTEQTNIIRTLEKKQSDSSEPYTLSSSYYFDELSKLNNELVGMQRELSRKNEEIKIANKELQKLNSVKDKFFSIISHDLKSPFHGLIGLTELMAADISSFSREEITTLMTELHENAKNFFKFLNNLLDWARMQQGNISFNPKELLLSEILSNNIELLRKTGEQKGIELISEVSKEFTVFADEDMLNSIMRNLLSNAVKFTKRGGRITITSKGTGENTAEIAVSDNGIGMNDSLLKKLFMMEEKVGSKGTEGEESTGLGLLLCKEFVERHGGKIWAESQKDAGSTFYFTLQSKIKNK